MLVSVLQIVDSLFIVYSLLLRKECCCCFVSEQVRVLALTDHDTMAGVPAALQAARQYGIRVIPGIEISAKYVTRFVRNSYFPLQDPATTQMESFPCLQNVDFSTEGVLQ